MLVARWGLKKAEIKERVHKADSRCSTVKVLSCFLAWIHPNFGSRIISCFNEDHWILMAATLDVCQARPLPQWWSDHRHATIAFAALPAYLLWRPWYCKVANSRRLAPPIQYIRNEFMLSICHKIVHPLDLTVCNSVLCHTAVAKTLLHKSSSKNILAHSALPILKQG